MMGTERGVLELTKENRILLRRKFVMSCETQRAARIFLAGLNP
jgi:hypothetical protein